MKTKLSVITILLFATLSIIAQPKAKYVFYFIGDGMGVNQVNAAETYLAALEGRIGTTPMTFASFPHVALVHTESATNGVTDSAAGGTALATGSKTKNGAIGVDVKNETLSSIATFAKECGMAVGVTTSVSIDHATPASFYAHDASRNSYHRIGHHLVDAGFDFYAGSDFLQPTHKDCQQHKSLYDAFEQAGYTLVRGEVSNKQIKKANKMVLMQTEEANKIDRSALPYAIDRTENDLELTDIVNTAVKFLEKKSDKGFFLMVEGGKIDWACHANDGATVIQETLDLDKAVQVAYAFYQKHPDETLIVVTADHETGGMALGRGPYELHLDLLQHQKMSASNYTRHISKLHNELDDDFTWDVVKADLTKHFGFWDAVKINERDEKALKNAYEALINGKAEGKKSLYSQEDAIATTARNIINRLALVGWTSGGHSNGYVPAFAIGVGAEQFHGRINNIDIPMMIKKTIK